MTEAKLSAKPVVYIFHGDDPHAIRRAIDSLTGQFDDAGLAELNTTHLDGQQASEEELFSAANALPFLAERRLVILERPFAKTLSDAARKRFLALLDGLPESTALVLVVDDIMERKKGETNWRSLPNKPTFWMRKWISRAGDRVFLQTCQLPHIKEMPAWIIKETNQLKGKITPAAAASLAAHVGNNTQMASQEIAKLLLYVDGKRAIELEDVENLTAQGGQADVFDMVDSLATGKARQALSQLHRLLETQDAPGLFGMIVRQFRLLIIARELLDEGRGRQMFGELRPEFVANKVADQAQRFTMSQLLEYYHRLLLIDEAYKTSQMPLELALDTFIAELDR